MLYAFVQDYSTKYLSLLLFICTEYLFVRSFYFYFLLRAVFVVLEEFNNGTERKDIYLISFTY